MTTARRHAAALLIAAATASNATPCDASRRFGPAECGVSWVASATEPVTSTHEAKVAAAACLQIVPDRLSQPELVEFTDLVGLGGDLAVPRVCWKVRGDVQVRGPRAVDVTMPLDVFLDVGTLQVAAVCTVSRRRWLLPERSDSPTDPMGEATDNGVVFEGTCIADHVGPTRAMEVAWNSWGVSPRAAGQIVLRPRVVSYPWPHIRRDGTVATDLGSRCMWTIIARGALYWEFSDGS